MMVARKQRDFGILIAIVVASVLAALSVGCQPELPMLPPAASDGAFDSDVPTPSTATAKSFVGHLDGSLALIGLVTEDDRVIAYVCDGHDGPQSISQWYEGTVDDVGLFWLEADAGEGGSGAYGTYSTASPLWGLIGGEFASGMLYDASGRAMAWDAQAVKDDSAAGLYVGDDGEVIASLVVLDERFALGLSRVRNTQTRASVIVPSRVAPRTTVPVQTAGRQIMVNPLRTPVDLRARAIVEVRNPGPATPPTDEPIANGVLAKSAAPTNAIQIKFRDGARVRLPAGTNRPIDENGRVLISRDARGLLDQVNGGQWFRSHLVEERVLDALRDNGQRRTGQALPDLNLYFNLLLPRNLRAADMAARFRRLPEVEWAWVMPDYYSADAPNFQDPVASGSALPYQQYLDAAPVGLDARYAWAADGGDGAGVRLVDIETAFNAAHVDLPSVTLAFEQDEAATAHTINHGTATLGVIAARNNGSGVTGIAHGAEVYFTPNSSGVPFALSYSIGLDGLLLFSVVAHALQPGDVILLEQQMAGPLYNSNSDYGLVAVEWYKPNYDAIRVATANGLVVVEAAGNGSQNLDGAAYRNNPDAYQEPFRFENGQRVNDSGAIIVGAGASGAGWSTSGNSSRHTRLNFSNYGGRVDMHAWGDAVVTAGTGFYGASSLYADGANDSYLDHYSGTSSASALMGGAVTAFQGFVKNFTGTPLTSAGMRANLRNTGTPQAGVPTQNIGPMPNLRAAIDAVFASTEPVDPPDPGLIQIGCQMLDIYYPDGVFDCQGTTPLPAPTWSLASGVISQDALAFLRPIFPNPWPASSLIQYTLDGGQPLLPPECAGPCGTHHWTKLDTNNCQSIAFQVTEFNAPLICRARLLNNAYCSQPGSVSPTVTRVYVPEGFIREPQFDRPSSYASDLRIHMTTSYPDNYPDGFAFVVYTLDGSTPVYSPNAAPGQNSPVWPDWNDDWGQTISIFADTDAEVVTLKARNCLILEGQFIAGEVVTWNYPRLN